VRKSFTLILTVVLISVLTLSTLAVAAPKQVSIITPYLASVTTNQMALAMKEGMEAHGWRVTIVDTKGDFADLASRMEDLVSVRTDAIVLVSTDPELVKTQIEEAAAAGIPVFGCDSGFIEGMVVNATSDNYAMGVQLTNFIFEAIGYKGKIIALTHRPHPGVVKRSQALDDLLPQYPEIKLITEQHVEVPGPIESARQIMENLLLANPQVGSIDAVWCAWDEPAIGVAQALQVAGREEVIVAGVDGNSQAVEMIKAGSPIKATVAQNFEGMAEIVVEEMARYFAGEQVEPGERYAPATLIVGDF
jgi:ribose transport system substrate-binding protein